MLCSRSCLKVIAETLRQNSCLKGCSSILEPLAALLVQSGGLPTEWSINGAPVQC